MRISDWSSDVCSSDLACRGCYARGLGGASGIISGIADFFMSKMSSNLKLLVKQAGARDRVAIKKRQIGAARRSNRRSSLCRKHGQVAASKRLTAGPGRDVAAPQSALRAAPSHSLRAREE